MGINEIIMYIMMFFYADCRRGQDPVAVRRLGALSRQTGEKH